MTDTTAIVPTGIEPELDEGLHERAKQIAKWLATAGLAKHLNGGSPEVCYFSAGLSLQWRLPPAIVVRHAYLGPGGKLDFEAKLYALRLMKSGLTTGLPIFYPSGDWSKINGRFRYVTNDRGNRVPEATWKPDDEIGLSMWMKIAMVGEERPREFEMPLIECQPRLSTRWATSPQRMCGKQCIKRFCDEVTPHLMMAIGTEQPLAIVPAAASPLFEPPLIEDKSEGEDPSTADAYALGIKAREEGQPISSVPYACRHQRAMVDAFRSGWQNVDADRDREKDAALS